MKISLKSGFYSYLLQAVIVGSIFFAGKLAYHKPNTVTSKSAVHIIFIENSWDEALRQAKLQKKYIFVDAYATWCGYCKLLKAQTFTDERAAEFYNSNFVNLSIDMEKGQGPALAQQWQISAYPTLIVFNADGKPVLGTAGFLKPGELIKFGKEALSRK